MRPGLFAASALSIALPAAFPAPALAPAGATAAKRFGLPLDLEGDFVVLGDAATAVGASRAEHDLSGLAGHRLRSHGGLGEQTRAARLHGAGAL